MMRLWLTLGMILWTSLAHATVYYLSPTGSNANNGTAQATPWLTFAHAQANGWGCGDTLFLLNGTYGDGTSTGTPVFTSITCTAGNEMILQALNERQAHIHDDGAGFAVVISASHYITLQGLRLSSATNFGIPEGPGGKCTSGGALHGSGTSTHLTMRKLLVHNPNKFCNVSVITFSPINDSLVEDVEIYDFHRHGMGLSGLRNTARRVYCNERDGMVSGGYGTSTPGNADSCISFYPCVTCIAENVVSDSSTGTTWEHGHFLAEVNAAGSSAGVTFLGVIGYQSKFHGTYINARGTGVNWMPVNNTVKHSVWYRHRGSTTVRSEGAKNTVVEHVTVLGDTNTSARHPAGNGVLTGVVPSFPGDGVYSITIRDTLVANLTNYGFNTASGAGTWSGNTLWAYQNVLGPTNPASSPNWTNVTNGVDPQMGTCVAWIPAGSPLKGAASDGGDIGATILYRYQDGVLTNVPLWDPTTGEFPHGALVTGINDVAGHSLFDFHTRININTNGCSFPPGYAGGGGGEPDPGVAHVSSTGTTSTSHSHTLPANTDAVAVSVALRDVGGAVGSVSSVTVCGNAASLITGAVATSSPAYRRAELWGYAPGTANTLSGACTIAVSTTGTVGGVVTTSSALADAEDFGTGVGATALSSAPTVTIPVNAGETILDSLAALHSVTLSSGPDQTLRLDTPLSAVSLRGSVSTQAASAGGVMSYTMGGDNYWALAAATVVPQGGSTPPSPDPQLTQSKFRWHALYGTEAAPIVKAATDTNVSIVTVGKIRLRIELTASAADYPATGLVLFCSRNGGAYAQAHDTFGSNVFRLVGAGANPDLPSSLTPTTQQIGTGDFVAGAILRSTSAVFAPTIPNGDHTEVEWALELNAAAGDTVACRVHQDNGETIDVYSVTPTLTVIPMMAGGGM